MRDKNNNKIKAGHVLRDTYTNDILYVLSFNNKLYSVDIKHKSIHEIEGDDTECINIEIVPGRTTNDNLG